MATYSHFGRDIPEEQREMLPLVHGRQETMESSENMVLPMSIFSLVLWFTSSSILAPFRNSGKDLESEARIYLESLNDLSSQKCYETTLAEWNYETNINSENEQVQMEKNFELAKLNKDIQKNVINSPLFHEWQNFKDIDLVRKLKKLTDLGPDVLPEDEYRQYKQLEADMTTHYHTTKICPYKNAKSCNLSVETDLTNILKNNRDKDELRHLWIEYHDKIGGPIKESYKKFVELSNRAARMNNFSDTGAYWLEDYESATFKDDIEQLWQTLKPLYQHLHAYVRAKIRDVYGDQISDDGLIPIHLLGDLWGQTFENFKSIAFPYPEKESIDVTESMKRQGYTPLKMFQVSDEFFTSLGLTPMPTEFWQESMLEKPKDREVVCHPSAWEFCNGKDFRIKQCTSVTAIDLTSVHHEMGHTQYQIQYKDQPMLYRNGANPGFHEAVGDTIALSVNTPKHLKKIGLLDESTPIDDYETSINFLFSMALDKVAMLPFSYIMDKYRWDIFDGSVNASSYNSHWWKLRKEYQGLKPPNKRTEDNFDAGAIYHVHAHVEYLRYFVGIVIQFQFHRSLCQVAGQYYPNDPKTPLHNCDIYQSKAAGTKLAAGLSMGSSRPWPEVMKVMTGQDKMDASAIREYFKPLEDWLIKENAKLAQTPGWMS